MKRNCLFFGVLFLTICGNAFAREWPTVMPSDNIFKFEDQKQESAIKFIIKGENGKSLYLIEGHINGWDLDSDYGFDFSGAIEINFKSEKKPN
jgi:hypothetical protein